MKRLWLVTTLALSLTATPALADEKTPIQGTSATPTTACDALCQSRLLEQRRLKLLYLCQKYGCP